MGARVVPLLAMVILGGCLAPSDAAAPAALTPGMASPPLVPELGTDVVEFEIPSGNGWVAVRFKVPASAWESDSNGGGRIQWGIEGDDVEKGATMQFSVEETALHYEGTFSAATNWYRVSSSSGPSDEELIFVFLAENLSAPAKARIGLVDDNGDLLPGTRSNQTIAAGTDAFFARYWRSESALGGRAEASGVDVEDDRAELTPWLHSPGTLRLRSNVSFESPGVHGMSLFVGGDSPRAGSWRVMDTVDEDAQEASGSLLQPGGNFQESARGGGHGSVHAIEVAIEAATPEALDYLHLVFMAVGWDPATEGLTLEHAFRATEGTPLPLYRLGR